MTTREENLKKINAELEKLSDDELEKIAGGTYLLGHEPNPMNGGKRLIRNDLEELEKIEGSMSVTGRKPENPFETGNPFESPREKLTKQNPIAGGIQIHGDPIGDPRIPRNQK